MKSSSLPNKIGEYTILSKLGEGGFGVVYLAHFPERPGFGKVAIKVFRVHDSTLAQLATSNSGDPVLALRERFIREAEILRSLHDYPHIVTVFEPPRILPDGSAYYVMPYLERSLANDLGKDQLGEDATDYLDENWRAKKVPIVRAVCILKELAMALSAVHAKGLVHRDIKPANILFNELGQLTLVDFGIAKLPDSEYTSLTGTNMGMGSRHYMAPEQYRSAKAVDARADIHAVGVLAYRMLTGMLPEKFSKAPSAYCPEAKGDLEKLVLRCMAEKPAERPADGNELLAELSTIRVRERKFRVGRAVLSTFVIILGLIACLRLSSTLEIVIPDFSAKLFEKRKTNQSVEEHGSSQKQQADVGKLWAEYYVPPHGCDVFKSDHHMVECVQHKKRARAEFDSL